MIPDLTFRKGILLFFALLAAGGLGITGFSLFFAYSRAEVPGIYDAFVLGGMLIAFGLLAMIAGAWLFFDEKIARPAERLAAEMRTHAHSGVGMKMDPKAARFLGDLAPAAAGLSGQLTESAVGTAAAVAAETERLAEEKKRLTRLLTEIPMAIALVNPAHQIVLYDGQAATVLAQVGHPRLNASLFDYFQPDAVTEAYARLVETGKEVSAHLDSFDGAIGFSVRMKPLGDAPGYMLIFEDSEAHISPQAERPLTYDFDLLEVPADAAFETTEISDLVFVVFDTETTGLLPHKDEIVQIGAVRVVRGRIVEGENMDVLVDPGVPIPRSSTRVHGITNEMVKGAPGIAQAGRKLHHFSRDAVIVAHNAPFDMAFLRRHSDKMDVDWNSHAILDTVLVSAVLFGAGETHTLDALCDRLGVVIPKELRHTALGDARATAEVLVRMLPMLQARGFRTFGDVIAETRKHGRLLEDLN
ncbi:3'-5' exonuclease [Ruegeria sediminis]|uniref:DNA-directed DNA polymerase n=1 Tax=Ruegeria sediminis TaxID=2583820 RepID=A0ABY2X282_9RHOB|nr:exonuclease domain-containing protein [Ruegeria sediminis]TMV08953.1 3'-5' exonuclease [Ruegeria sediminis]